VTDPGPAPAAAPQRRVTPLQTLVLGQVLIGTASWAALIAIQIKASYELHQGALYLAVVAMAWGAPTIVLSPLVGRIIDSRGPRTVGIAASGVSIAASLGLAFAGGLGLLWAMTLISGVARAFSQPAVDAMPSWLPGPVEYVKSSVWLGFATSLPIIAGPALAATCVAAWGTSSAFGVNAVAYLLGGSVFILLRLTRTPGAETAEQNDARGGPGMRSLLVMPGLRVAVVLTLIVWISYGAFSPLEILYVKSVLHAPAGTFATIEIVFGSGLLAATLLIARYNALLSRRFFLPVSVLLVGGSEILYICTDRLSVAYAGVCLWGVAAGLFGPACRLALLRGTPAEHHGRAMALWRALQSFGTLAPPTAAGAVAHFAGIQPTLIGLGTMVAVTGTVACALIGFRRGATTRTDTPTPRAQQQKAGQLP
jgi:MFS family permease